jgi:phage-related minor tail protein
MMEVYKAARPGLLSLLTPSFNNQPGVPTTTPDFEGAGFFLNQAKGGAFDLGIKTYAKGGMFTNSIVNQPTLFKFARGTGLMGEAGPEAIMPLKRDSQGNLGVSGGGQKTEVVINNYSNQPATTQETTDSRGNRKIEVVIGEMTAGEFQRSGSTSQRAMRSTFGLAPQLIRR